VLKGTGIAEVNIMSVRAAAYHKVVLKLHHINIIKEKYFFYILCRKYKKDMRGITILNMLLHIQQWFVILEP